MRVTMVDVLENPSPAALAPAGEFVARASAQMGACGEHDPAWLTVLRDGLGHRPYALMDKDAAGAVVGYLPLVFVKSALFGKFLVSLSYLNRASIVARDTASAMRLVEAACDLADKLDANYLELRHATPIEHPRLNARRDEKQRMVMDLPATPEALMKGFDAKLRNQVRKGDKSNFTLRWGGLDVLDDFYRVFAINMRDLGTPVYPRGLFAAMMQNLNGKAELAVVDYQGQTVAGALLVHDGERPGEAATTQVPSASSLRQFNSTNANMWMYHQLLVRAIGRGSQQFDFGRSSVDSGTYKFKKQWGAKPYPTVWQYYVRRGDVQAARPDNPKYQRRIAMWQKLPVWLTRLIGPAIVRGIP